MLNPQPGSICTIRREYGKNAQMQMIRAVFLGGALGSLARWALNIALPVTPNSGFPWSTLIVNVVGCAAIGFASRKLERGTRDWAFAVTGVLGGFTTMSTFALEVGLFTGSGQGTLALVYVVATVSAGLMATYFARGAQ